MKIVGLTMDGGRLGVTVLQRTFGRTEVLDSFQRAYSDDAGLAAILREKAPAWAGARIVSAIPGRSFAQRTLAFPFADRKRIEKAVPFELEDLVPFELGDTVIDHIVLESARGKEQGARVLCLVLPKSVLKRHLDLLAGAGVEPAAVVPSFAGLSAVASMIPANGTALLLNNSDICLVTGPTVQSMRSFGVGPSGGFLQLLQSLEAERKERIERSVVLAADEGVSAALAEAGIAVERVQPELGGKKVADPGSLGTALTTGVNFRKDEFAFRAADEGARRRKRTLIIAAGLAAALFGVNVAVKLSIVRSGYGKLDGEIRAIYQDTFPDARPASDPVRQMRDRVAEAQRMFGALGSGTSALDVMKTVTDGIPKEIRVSFTEFSLEGDRLKLQGDAASFEVVDRIKAELSRSPLFSDVVVQDTRMGVDSKVKFRFEIKLQQGM